MTDTRREVIMPSRKGVSGMAKNKRYNKEFRLQAARLVTEQGYSLRDAAERLGVSAWSIRYWIKKFQQTAELPAQNQPVSSAEELKPPLLLAQQARGQVSDSGYYDRLKYEPSAAWQRRQTIAQAAARFYFESQRIYGYRKVYEDLRQADINCCRETVRRIMCQIGLYSRVKRRFVHTTDSNHNMTVAQNLLDRDFKADEVNTKWAADITYIPTQEGWLYLAAVMDLYSRRIIGWSMSEDIDSKLVTDALRMAISQRKPPLLLAQQARGQSICI